MKAQIASAHEGGYDFGGKCGDLLTAAAALAAAGARGRNFLTCVTSTVTDLLRPHGTLALAYLWKPALESAASAATPSRPSRL